jgi:outer membrane protein TolC
MTKFFIPTVIALLWVAGVYGQQQARQFTLEEAIDYALQENLAIKNAQISIADAEEQIIERRSAGLPKLTGSVNFQRYLAVPRQPLPEGFDIFGIFGQALAVDLFDQLSPATQMAVNQAFSDGGGDSGEEGIAFFLKNNFTAAINLDAMIFDPSYFVALQAAKAYRKYTLRDFSTVQRTVTNQVTEAYLPVLLIQQNIELLDKNISNLSKLLYETRELYNAGFVEQLDIDRLDLSLANLKIERENLVRQKDIAEDNLKYNMGYPINEPIVLADNLETMLASANADSLAAAEVNYSRRAEYNLLEEAISLNELNIKLNKAGYLPSLRLFGAAQQQYQGDDFETGFWAPSSYVGLNLSVPIFDGFDKRAKIQRAKLELEKAINQREDLTRAITLEIANARTNYLNAQQRLDSQQRNLGLAERIYDTSQIKYREGVGSSLEVTQAEQSLYDTQSNYMQALYDLILAQARLDLALGNDN